MGMDEAYAMEELVVAFLCADLGITDVPRADHAQYLDNWLRVLKADKRAIFTAASKLPSPPNSSHPFRRRESRELHKGQTRLMGLGEAASATLRHDGCAHARGRMPSGKLRPGAQTRN